MNWWNTEPHSGMYGRQTVVPPAWPQVDEEILAQSATRFESLKIRIRASVIPALRAQMMAMSDAWDGVGSEAARNEASAIIDQHEANATASDDVANKLRAIESAVVKTKIAANTTAEQAQADCEAIAADKALPPEVKEALIKGRITEGLADNLQLVASNTVELASNIDVAPGTPGANGAMFAGTTPPLPRSLPTQGTPDFNESNRAKVPYFQAAQDSGGGSAGVAGGAPAPTPPTPQAAPAAPLAAPADRPAAAAAPTHAIGGSSSSAGGGASSGLSSSGG
ncbi:MAG: hypothetical protein K0U84_19970, partial [Actinomycetia bacterium]|nr:hypothetical protein [Actinomycetes bacterium]